MLIYVVERGDEQDVVFTSKVEMAKWQRRNPGRVQGGN